MYSSRSGVISSAERVVDPLPPRTLLRLSDRGELDSLQIGNMNTVGTDTPRAGSDGVNDIAVVQVVVRVNFHFLLLELVAANRLQSRNTLEDA